MPTLTKRIAVSTGAQIISKVITSGLGMLVTFMLTHSSTIGHAGFGVYTFAFVFTGVFTTFSDWGLGMLAVREGSANEDRAEEIIGHLISLRFLLAIFVFLAAVVTIQFFPQVDMQTKIITSIAAFSLIAMSIKTSFQIIFQTKIAMQYSTIVEIVGSSLSAILVFILIKISAGLILVTGAVVGANFIAAVIAVILGYRLLPIKLTLRNLQTKFYLKEAFYLGLVGGLLTIYNRADILLLSSIKGTGVVADYGLAYKIFDVVYTLGSFFVASLIPVISRVAKENRKFLSDLLLKCILVILPMGVVLNLMVLILAPLAVSILGGKDFASANLLLRVLSLVLTIAILNQLIQVTFIALNKQQWLIRIGCLALIENVIANVILIPSLGPLAAAINTVLTEGLVLIYGLWLLLNVGKIKFTLKQITSAARGIAEGGWNLFDTFS